MVHPRRAQKFHMPTLPSPPRPAFVQPRKFQHVSKKWPFLLFFMRQIDFLAKDCKNYYSFCQCAIFRVVHRNLSFSFSPPQTLLSPKKKKHNIEIRFSHIQQEWSVTHHVNRNCPPPPKKKLDQVLQNDLIYRQKTANAIQSIKPKILMYFRCLVRVKFINILVSKF